MKGALFSDSRGTGVSAQHGGERMCPLGHAGSLEENAAAAGS